MGERIARPTPVVAAPFTPMWRPWEEEENVVVHLSAEVQKRKRRSPAAEARSRQRLLQWQQKRDRHRPQLESRNTPHRSIETSKTWTILTKRLENKHILNICEGGCAASQGQEEAERQERLCRIAMKSKLLCIHSYYSRLCQVFPL